MSSSDTLARYNALQSQRDAATQNLQQDTADAGKLPQMLKDSINQRYNNFQPVIQDEADARMNLYNAPTDAQVRYQNVFNPFVRSNLEAKAVNLAQNRYDVARGVRNGIFDTLDNIIGQGVNGYNSMLQGKKIGLDNLNQQSQEALSLYGTQKSAENAAASLALQQQQLQAQRDEAAAALKYQQETAQNQKIYNESALKDYMPDDPQNYATLRQIGAQDMGNGTYKLPLTGRIIKIGNPPTNINNGNFKIISQGSTPINSFTFGGLGSADRTGTVGSNLLNNPGISFLK